MKLVFSEAAWEDYLDWQVSDAKFPERFQAKWMPVRVKKTRKNRKPEPRSDSIGSEQALERLNGLIKECARTPFAGTGKPEPLRGALSGWWSRRLTQEHRLVYRVVDGALHIAQCRYHYG